MRWSNPLARARLRKAESSPVLRKVRPVAGTYRNESLGRLVPLAWCLHTLWETSGRLGQQLGCVRAGDLCVRARPRLECLRPVQSFVTQVAFRGLTASKRDARLAARSPGNRSSRQHANGASAPVAREGRTFAGVPPCRVVLQKSVGDVGLREARLGKTESSGRGPSQLRVTVAGETTSGSRSRWLSRGTGEGPRRVPAEGRRLGSGKPFVLHGACGGSDLGLCPTVSSVNRGSREGEGDRGVRGPVPSDGDWEDNARTTLVGARRSELGDRESPCPLRPLASQAAGRF